MRKRAQFGFTYLAVMFAVAISSVALAGVASLWSIEEQREREIALLFVGDQYRRAIASYYENTPGGGKQYPRDLRALLEDRRVSPPMRHLRRPYPDPVSGKPWALVKTADGAIAGVYSRSTAAPLQRANFDDANEPFNGKARYSEWQFIYTAHQTRDMPAVFLPLR